MKKIYSLVLAVAVYAVAFTQIPNAGFENWTSVGSYEDPDGWATMNFISVPNGHTSCEKSTDNHSGSYSLKVTNNTALGQMQGGWGIVATGGFEFPFKPAFPVSGHPTSLGGWYKFNALGGDSGLVMTMLFYQGAVVAQSSIELPGIANWTQFSYNLEPYTNADSATIVVFAFRTNGPNDPPNGNSSLWIDDISFGSTTGIGNTPGDKAITMYPNPAVNNVWLNNLIPGSTITVYNLLGEALMREQVGSSSTHLNVNHLDKGVYMVQIKNGQLRNTQRLIIE